MKVLKVFSEDYAALSFEDCHRGESVSNIIANPDKFKPKDKEVDEQWDLKVFEFEGDVDMKFVDFIRTEMIDYDSGKHETFYIEGETVGGNL